MIYLSWLGLDLVLSVASLVRVQLLVSFALYFSCIISHPGVLRVSQYVSDMNIKLVLFPYSFFLIPYSFFLILFPYSFFLVGAINVCHEILVLIPLYYFSQQ